jgi:predicted O-methyltransferase YrrM
MFGTRCLNLRVGSGQSSVKLGIRFNREGKRLLNGSATRWLMHWLGLRKPDTQTTVTERACLTRYAKGKRSLVEIGVMHGVSTALLRRSMDFSGTLTAIDPHPRGSLGVSFERLIAMREINKISGGHVTLLRQFSHEAASIWEKGIDFLFVDGDHSWSGIDRDWKDWSRFVLPGGIVVLHDSASVADREDLESVRYTREVILADRRFQTLDTVESMTVLKRVEEGRS